MTLGIIIILIVIFGFVSNWLNWKYLNYKLTHYLYYIGAFVHESSHAILCLLTGSKVEEYKVFTEQPHVTHTKSRIPIVGEILISAAPIFGGILFLFIVNYFISGFDFKLITTTSDWRSILLSPLQLIQHINYLSWQGWVMVLLLINAGAMIGPSIQDMKNIWFVFIPLFFINIPTLNDLCFTAFIIILANIYIQLILIAVLGFVSLFRRK